jgi:hypothetical protein
MAFEFGETFPFPEGSGVVVCKRCDKPYEGLECLCIQDVANRESIEFRKARLLEEGAVASLWGKTVKRYIEGKAEMVLINHLRARGGLTVCGKKIPVTSKYTSPIMDPAQARKLTNCKKCVTEMGWLESPK